MDFTEIRRRAIYGSKAYYDWLKDNNRGIVNIGIAEIIEAEPYIILRTDDKPFNFANIYITVCGIKQDEEDITLVEHNKLSKELIILPGPQIYSNLCQANPKDVLLIADLTFLVKRTQTWYENHERLVLPKSAPLLSFKSKFQADMLPTTEQENVLQEILNYPISYVWGAPGTGKTQIVLAYSILNYIEQGKKVLICAPTNHALEQSLRGIINLLAKANIPYHVIRRLGVPSSSFRKEFPLVCETSQPSQIKKINVRQKNIEQHNNITHVKECMTKLQSLIKQTEVLIPAQQSITATTKLLSEQEAEFCRLQDYHLPLQNSLIYKNKLLVNLLKKQNSFSYKIKQIFNSRQIDSISEQVALLRKEIDDIQAEITTTRNLLADFTIKNQAKQQEIIQLKSSFQAKTREIQNNTYFAANVQDIFANLSYENIEQILAKARNLYNQGDLYINSCSNNEVAQFSLTDSDHNLAELKTQQIEMQAKTAADDRLVQVWACTFDAFMINKFADIKHVFVDEAGYSCLIKTIPLLSLGKPLTLLGDHKQLPPVCELADSQISQNEFEDVFMWSQSSLYLSECFDLSFEQCLTTYLERYPAKFAKIKLLQLSATYRFGKPLADLLEKYIYQNGFYSCNANLRLYVLNAKYIKGDKLRENISEVAAIKKHIANSKPADYAIITPYRDQAALLKKELPSTGQIMTVHSAQGQEWDRVYFSVTDTVKMWFTDSQNRKSNSLNLLNTAISRTKQELIIVCDYQFWSRQEQQFLGKLVQECEIIE